MPGLSPRGSVLLAIYDRPEHVLDSVEVVSQLACEPPLLYMSTGVIGALCVSGDLLQRYQAVFSFRSFSSIYSNGLFDDCQLPCQAHRVRQGVEPSGKGDGSCASVLKLPEVSAIIRPHCGGASGNPGDEKMKRPHKLLTCAPKVGAERPDAFALYVPAAIAVPKTANKVRQAHGCRVGEGQRLCFPGY